MFYKVVDNQINCADYKFENDCKEYKGLTLDEYSAHPNKIIVKGDIVIPNPNYEKEEQEKAKQTKIEEIKAQLKEVDEKSIRALRDGDIEYIEKYKQEAIFLREKLHELGGF